MIQELVCTDDGTPFTTLIKVAAARSERETVGRKGEEGSKENEGERRRKGGGGRVEWRVYRGDQYLAANRSQLWPIEPPL